MDKISILSEIERDKIFKIVAAKMNTENVIVEKDLWLTWVLGKIFADEALSKIMMFKGGTSLSNR